MSSLIISGGRRLSGTVKISPAKNAVLPIMVGTLLAGSPCYLEEVPDLADVRSICSVIEHLGARVTREGQGLHIKVEDQQNTEAPYDFVRSMRASFLVMGPLLAKRGRARIPTPGGCAIGTRPIDLHLKGFYLLGAGISQGQGYIEARADKLTGSRVYLDYPSVGATENIMMAGVLARGQTIIENAAEEPEVVDLANFLNAMGARIKGAGTKMVRIDGVDELHGVTYNVIPDRIEAGTFLLAAAITGGEVVAENVIRSHITPVLAKLIEAGAGVEEGDGWIAVYRGGRIRPADVKTLPYPGFPTDMQPQFMSLMSVAAGTSVITETVFENRFMHVNELKRMGARVKISGRTAIVQGVEKLSGARVKATDLRAGAALVLAGLVAQGETEISNVYHIERGYECFTEKLAGLGADISIKG